MSRLNDDLDGEEPRAARSGSLSSAGPASHVAADPTKDASLLRGRNDDKGFHTWTEDELTRFEARWPVGTHERLAFDILLYTGLRRGDAVTLGRQHVRGGTIFLRKEKTGGEVTLPVLPARCVDRSLQDRRPYVSDDGAARRS